MDEFGGRGQEETGGEGEGALSQRMLEEEGPLSSQAFSALGNPRPAAPTPKPPPPPRGLWGLGPTAGLTCPLSHWAEVRVAGYRGCRLGQETVGGWLATLQTLHRPASHTTPATGRALWENGGVSHIGYHPHTVSRRSLCPST